MSQFVIDMTFLVHDQPHDVIDVGMNVEISFLKVRNHFFKIYICGPLTQAISEYSQSSMKR